MSEGGARTDSRLVIDVDDLPEPAFSVTLNRRIVTWNAAAERYFSLRPADVIGRFCSEIVVQGLGMRGTPCAYCALAKRKDDPSSPDRGAGALGTGAASTLGFRTFSARSTTGEVQLVHLLSVSHQSGAVSIEPPRQRESQTEESLPPSLLTPREREVLRLLAGGLTTSEIAARLSISRITARNHVTHVMDKLEVNSRLRAVVVATQKGLL